MKNYLKFSVFLKVCFLMSDHQAKYMEKLLVIWLPVSQLQELRATSRQLFLVIYALSLVW